MLELKARVLATVANIQIWPIVANSGALGPDVLIQSYLNPNHHNNNFNQQPTHCLQASSIPKSSKRKGKDCEEHVLLMLFCVVHPVSSPFSVRLSNDDTVDNLKKAIKLENTCLNDIDAHEFTLYKVL